MTFPPSVLDPLLARAQADAEVLAVVVPAALDKKDTP